MELSISTILLPPALATFAPRNEFQGSAQTPNQRKEPRKLERPTDPTYLDVIKAYRNRTERGGIAEKATALAFRAHDEKSDRNSRTARRRVTRKRRPV